MPNTAAITKPDSKVSIDGVAGGVEALKARLKGGDKITSRELRSLWSQRLRSFWRLHVDMYRAISKRFLEQGDNYLAIEAADEGAQFFGDDVALILTRALATARSGAPQAAQALLARKETILTGANEAKSLLARTFKDLWKSSGEERYLQEAFDLYQQDYLSTKGDRTFPGVNAASMALFLGRKAEAKRIADDVLGLLRARGEISGYWDEVTVAECLLVAGEIDQARTAYTTATKGGQVPYAHLATTRSQTRLLLRQFGRAEEEFDACFPLPGVVAFTGHRIDGPDRLTPRFPEAEAPRIKERIREAITRAWVGFGYAGAANGADILFLECMQEAGLETYVHLPLPEEEFLRASVLPSGSPEWAERFHAVTARATEYTCATQTGTGALPFDYGNRLMLGAAGRHARQLGANLRLLTVWDGRPGERGDGGTGDCVQTAREAGFLTEVIDLNGAPAQVGEKAKDTGEKPEQLLSILALSLASEEAESLLAESLSSSQPMHRDVADHRVRLFFRTPGEAAQAARAILRDLREHLTGSLGLHAGPMRVGQHPVTGATVVRGEHIARADEFAALDPTGLIYASAACVALLGLQSPAETKSEFLGYRSVRQGAAREPVFQILP